MFRKSTDIVELRYMNKVMKQIDQLGPRIYDPNRITWQEPEEEDEEEDEQTEA